MTKVFAIANGKGGVGKSTITSNIAGYLHTILKKEVLIVDLDFQSSSLDWASLARSSDVDVCDVVSLASDKTERHLIVKNTQLQIERFREKYDFILIDCRGAIDEYTIGAIRSADMVITPLSSSILDLQATSTLLDLFEQINASKNYTMTLHLVLNDVIANAVSVKKAIEAINERVENSPNLKLSNAILYRREEYKNIWGEGKSIVSSDNKQAKDEFFSFIDELGIEL